MTPPAVDEVICDILGGCHRAGLPGGAHACRECGVLVHNLYLQEISGIDDALPVLCGLSGCVKDMAEEEKERTLQAYRDRNASSSDGDTGGGGAREISAGSNCREPTHSSAPMSAICDHGNLRHFNCDKLPCMDGCADYCGDGVVLGSGDGRGGGHGKEGVLVRVCSLS